MDRQERPVPPPANIGPELTAQRIASFKADLGTLQPRDIVRKNIIQGQAMLLSDDAYFALRSTIARKYDVHPNDVLVVGSAKLGFSIAPRKQYRPFCDESDVDVVIVSEGLFSTIWQRVHQYEDSGGYWEGGPAFKEYLFNGWIRPDKFPRAKAFEICYEWWEFFKALAASGDYTPYKIRAALYKNWYFLESYQMRAVSACADAAKENER